MESNFLAINKNYFRMGLRSVDILIIAQVEEFQRNGCQCYVTNEQLSDMFGESIDTIKRSLTKLEKMNIINRNTSFVTGNGKSNRQRILSVNNQNKWKVHNAPTNEMEGANSDDGRCKKAEWKVHNAPIKDNLKDNIKDNLSPSFSFSKEDKRELEETLRAMNLEQLTDIKQKYDEHTSYKEIAEQYNIRYFDADLFKEKYNVIYQERYDVEHPEEAQKRKEAEIKRKEEESRRLQQQEEEAEYHSILWKNRKKQRVGLDSLMDEYLDDAI